MLVLIAAAAGYLSLQGPGVIVELAKRILRENGLPEVEFAVSRVSLETVTLEGIRIGREGALKIPRISAIFTWRELIDGAVGEISIDGLELSVRQREHGLSFGELDPFVYGVTSDPGDDSAITSFRWPFRKLALGNARITLLDQDDGQILAVTIDGAVQRAQGGGLEIGPARVSATSPEVSLAAAITAAVSGDGRLSASMALQEGAADIHGFAIRAEDGLLELGTPLNDLSRLEATGRLTVSEVALPLGLATAGELDMTIRDGKLKAAIRARDTARDLQGTLTLDAGLTEPLAAQPVDISITLAAADAARLPDGLLPIPVTQGAAELTLTLADTVGNLQSLARLDGLLALARAFPAIRVGVKGSGIATPALPGGIDIETALRLEGIEGGVAVLAPTGARATLTPSDAEDWRALLGPLAQTREVAPLQISMVSADGAPLMVFRPGEILQKSAFEGSLHLTGGALPDLHADLSAAVILDPEAGIFDASVDRMIVTTGRAVLDSYTLTDFALTLAAHGTERGASGEADLAVRISGGTASGLKITDGKIVIPASWRLAPDRLQLSLRDCAALTVPKAQVTGAEIDLRGVHFCLRHREDTLLEMASSGADTALTGEMNAVLTTQGRDIVVLTQDGRRARIDGKGNRVSWRGSLTAAGTIGLDAEVALGAVILPDTLLRLSGLTLSAQSQDIADKIDTTIQATLTDLEKPFRFAPVDLALDATAVKLDAVSATGTIAMNGAPLKLEWEAEHALAAQKGRATMRVLPFEFGFGVNRLADATSLLDGVVSRPAGQLLGAASASWSGGSGCGNGDLLIRQASAVLSGDGSIPVPGEISLGQIGLTARLCADAAGITSQAGQLLLDSMEFNGDQMSAKSINANIDIRTFLPFATAPDQVLSVGVVDLGFPLTDGLASFQVTEGSTFDLTALTFNWAGGTVAVAPLQIGPDTPLRAIDLSVDGAQLSKLADLVPDKGVTGEGILDGRLPIRLTDDGPSVEQGYLEARGPGVLRYKRQLGAGEEASAVDDVLSNLQYSKLRMDIDGGLSGGVTIGLSVEGKNPDYLNGYPVVLDVNVNGPLGVIMNDGLATYKVPSQILERMRRFGQLQ